MTATRAPAPGDPPATGPADANPPGSSITRLILVLAFAGFASTFAGRAVEPLVAVLARDLNSDPHTVALLSTAFALPYALIQPILGPIGDALGKERVMTACLAVLTAALAGCAIAGNIDLLFGLRMLAGAAAGGVIPLALALMGDRIPIERRQVGISRFLVAVILGQLSGSTFAGLIEGQIGWRGVLAITAIVGAAGFGAALFGFERGLGAPPRRPEFRKALERYATIIANPRARVLFAAVFVEAIAIFGIFPHLAPLMEARAAGGPREAGLVLAGFAVGGLIYAAIVALLVRFLGMSRMLMVGGATAAVALCVLSQGGSWQVDSAAMVALGLGFYMLHNTFQTQVTEVAPKARASAVALHAFSYFCGQAIGVAILGGAIQAFGQTITFSICAAATLCLGVATATLLGRPVPQPTAS